MVVAAGLVAYSFEVMGLSPFVLTGKTAEGLPRFHLPPFSETAGNRTVPFREMAQVCDMLLTYIKETLLCLLFAVTFM